MTRLTKAQLQALPKKILFDSRAADTTRTEAHKALIAVEDEKATASRFWEWVTDHESQYPQLLWLTHHESGGYRPDGVAARLKREGQRPGFPDYALYWANTVACDFFVGWAMELKRADHSNHPTDLQAQWLTHLAWEGWKCVVCYGADEAIAALKEYLEDEDNE